MYFPETNDFSIDNKEDEDVKIEMKKNSKAFNTMKLSLKKIFDDYVLQLS